MPHAPKDGFPYYFDLVKEGSLPTIFNAMPTLATLESISEAQANFRYEANKWSIKQVIGHITDHERIKMFRAFQLSRNVDVALWGYDQEHYVDNSRFDELPLQTLLTDYVNARQASISFIETLSDRQLQLIGMARQYEITLEEFLRSIIGHETHHVNVIREKYLSI